MMRDRFSWSILRAGGRSRRKPTSYRPAVHNLEDRNLLSFIAPINYPTDGGPVAAGDFTGHGHVDLAVATGNTVGILPGNGNGTFQPELPPVNVGPHIAGVAAADLTGNGILDLVITHDDETSASHTLTVLLGNGDGTFRAPVDYEAGPNPHGVAIGDFTGNGIPDIVVTNQGFFFHDQFHPGTTVTVLRGNGDGTFQPPRTFDSGVTPTDVAVGDFTGDGRLSIVTADEGFTSVPSDISLLRGNGNGTFQEPVSLSLGMPAAARSLTVADLNGDGHLDIVAASASDNGGIVSVLLGRGNGTFQNTVTFPVSNDPGFLPSRLALGDFSGDGHLDAAVAGGGGSSPPVGLYVLPGNGDGTFQAPTAIDTQQSGTPVVGDFNGNGIDDLAVESGSVTSGGGSVAILLGQPGSFFAFPSKFLAGAGATSVQSADLTGSGFHDLVTADSQDNTVSVALANGDGTFQPPVAYAVGQDPEALVLADVNGDGIPDLVVLNVGDRTVSVLLGNGDGSFQTAQTITLNIDPSLVPVRLALGDFTGDGTLALAVLQRSTQTGNSAVLVLRGHGDGTFSQDPNLPDETLSFGINERFGNYFFQAADLRHNGTLDLVYGGGGNAVFIALGNGNGTFQQPQALRLQDVPTSVTVGDLTGSGIPDLVVTTRGPSFESHPNSVLVFLGNGDGTFQAPVGYAVPGPSWAATIADFDGDGVPDLAVENGDKVRVLRGNGDGTFGPPTSYLVGVVAGLSGSMTVGDFNGDGATDLAMVNSFNGAVTVVLNRNDGTAPARQTAGRLPHHTAARSHLARQDTALAQAMTATPATSRPDTTAAPTSAPASAREAAATDVAFAALARESHDAVFVHHRQESRSAGKAWHPVGSHDEEFAALLAGLLPAATAN